MSDNIEAWKAFVCCCDEKLRFKPSDLFRICMVKNANVWRGHTFTSVEQAMHALENWEKSLERRNARLALGDLDE